MMARAYRGTLMHWLRVSFFFFGEERGVGSVERGGERRGKVRKYAWVHFGPKMPKK